MSGFTMPMKAEKKDEDKGFSIPTTDKPAPPKEKPEPRFDVPITFVEAKQAWTSWENEDGERRFAPCGHKVTLSTGVVVIRSKEREVEEKDILGRVTTRIVPGSYSVTWPSGKKVSGLTKSELRRKFSPVLYDAVMAGMDIAELDGE